MRKNIHFSGLIYHQCFVPDHPVEMENSAIEIVETDANKSGAIYENERHISYDYKHTHYTHHTQSINNVNS